jgi:hypothetical protein
MRFICGDVGDGRGKDKKRNGKHVIAPKVIKTGNKL